MFPDESLPLLPLAVLNRIENRLPEDDRASRLQGKVKGAQSELATSDHTATGRNWIATRVSVDSAGKDTRLASKLCSRTVCVALYDGVVECSVRFT